MIYYHRLLWIERPIITYRYEKWVSAGEWSLRLRKGKLNSLDMHRRACDRPETSRKRAIKKNKKGLIIPMFLPAP